MGLSPTLWNDRIFSTKREFVAIQVTLTKRDDIYPSILYAGTYISILVAINNVLIRDPGMMIFYP